MSNKNFNLHAKGAVLILVLFAAAVGITGILYRQNADDARQTSVQEPFVESVSVVTQSTLAPSEPVETTSLPALALSPTEPDLPAMAVTPSEPVQSTRQESTQAAQAAAPKVLQTASPVSGSTISEYAMDCLSYNETTRDWRTHNGIDLAAEDGSPVSAAADGTVYTTYEDDSLGYTVVIRHDGGYTTRYSSLKEELCVKPGDTVKLGQTIGYASDSALVETVMGSHVHFSVSYQDKPMDPEDFFALS